MRTYGALTVVSRDTGRLPIYLGRNLLAARGYPHYRGYRDRAHTAGDYYYYTIRTVLARPSCEPFSRFSVARALITIIIIENMSRRIRVRAPVCYGGPYRDANWVA